MNNCIALSVDVEDWYHSQYVMGSDLKVYEKSIEDLVKNWDNKLDYVTEPTERLLKIFDYYNVKATFFIVSDVAQTNPDLIRKISAKGHEIACHSFHHSEIIDSYGKPRMEENIFKETTKKSKDIIERICNKEIIGYRSPGAWIGGWAIDVLEDLGFKYDSSVCINSLYNKLDIKPNNVTTIPYFPKRGSLEKSEESRGIIEFPWSFWNFLGLKFPTGGGPFLRYCGTNYIIQGLSQSLRRGDTMFYLHPLDISDKYPKNVPKRPLFWYGKGHKAEISLRRILQRYSKHRIFKTHSEIREKWLQSNRLSNNFPK